MDSSLSFLLNKSSDFFCILDRDGILLHTNESFRTTLGYLETELEGTPVSEISHPADIKRRNESFQNLTADNPFTVNESRIKAKNGQYFNVLWSIILSAEDDHIYTIGTNLTTDLNITEPGTITDNIRYIIQSFNEGFFIVNNSWAITAFNPAFQAITGLTGEQLKNTNINDLSNLGLTAEVLGKFHAAFNGNIYNRVEYFNAPLKKWLRINIYPYKNEVTAFLRDITSLKIQQLILALEKHVLEFNASPLNSLARTIDELLKGIEKIFPDMICSVLELDDAQEKLYHLSAPSLPVEYCELINGSIIGPKAGSCGTAAYHRSQIIVNDIETDSLWDDYRQLILPYGFKACWSSPIISSHSSQVLATFAVYYMTAREPAAEELQMIERTSNILRVIIENKKNQEYLTEQTERLQEIASISSHELRRPVATILGLVNLFDHLEVDNPLNHEIINHLHVTAQELDSVIHAIVEKTIYLKGEGNLKIP